MCEVVQGHSTTVCIIHGVYLLIIYVCVVVLGVQQKRYIPTLNCVKPCVCVAVVASNMLVWHRITEYLCKNGLVTAGAWHPGLSVLHLV